MLAWILPGSAVEAQLDRESIRCRKVLAAGVKRLSSTLLRAQQHCHVLRLDERLAPSTDCNDLSSLPRAAKVLAIGERFAASAARACSLADPPEQVGFTACPVPCEGEDVSTYDGIARCLACLTTDRVGALSATTTGNTAVPASPAAQRCQSLLRKSLAYLGDRMGAQQRCQVVEDKRPAAVECLDHDADGRLARLRSNAAALLARCSAEALVEIDACADDLADVQHCTLEAVESVADELFQRVYFPTPALRLRIANPTDMTQQVSLSGTRVSGPPVAWTQVTAYAPRQLSVPPGGIEVALLIPPAPGVWLHHVEVPDTGQVQHRQTHVLARSAHPAYVDWQIFRSVLEVNDGGDSGDGVCDASCTLRDAIATANTSLPPVLIRFDHAAFPGGDAVVTITNPVALQIFAGEVWIDGTNAEGDPSPLQAFEARVYRSTVTMVAPNADPIPGDCPCSESQGGSFRISAPDVHLRGLQVRRVLAAEGTVCCGDQDLITFGADSKNGVVETARLDGGAAAFGSAEVPPAQTRPPTGKDCIDADNTSAGDGDPVTIEQTEIAYCYDRGVKSRRGVVRLEGNWIHHNLRGGVFAQSPDSGDLRGVVDARRNLIERNGQGCASGDPAACGSEPITRAGASELSTQGPFSAIESDGNVVRDGVLHGFLLQNQSQAELHDDYVCGIRRGSGGKGVLFQSTSGSVGDFRMRGAAVVYNDDAGVKFEGIVTADLGSDGGVNAGHNAFTQNGAVSRRNLRNILDGLPPVIAAQGNQWQHCYPTMAPLADECDSVSIGNGDTNNSIGLSDRVDVGNALPHQGSGAVVIHHVTPTQVGEGAWVHIYGSGFDAISGHHGGVAGDCHALASGNRCSPLQGSCVEFLVDGIWTEAADVIAVTPRHLVVRAPFDCTQPTELRVRRPILGGGESVSDPIAFCENAEP